MLTVCLGLINPFDTSKSYTVTDDPCSLDVNKTSWVGWKQKCLGPSLLAGKIALGWLGVNVPVCSLNLNWNIALGPGSEICGTKANLLDLSV